MIAEIIASLVSFQFFSIATFDGLILASKIRENYVDETSYVFLQSIYIIHKLLFKYKYENRIILLIRQSANNRTNGTENNNN